MVSAVRGNIRTSERNKESICTTFREETLLTQHDKMPKFSVTAVHFFYAGRCMLPRRKTTACLEVPRFHFFFLSVYGCVGLVE